MSLRNPPRLAVALLKRFALTHNEAFVGDLIEEFHGGRTAGWFWRQTLTAIFAATRRTARRPDVRPLIIGYGIGTAISIGFLLIRGGLPAYPVWESLLFVGALLALASLTLAFRPTGYVGKAVLECGWLLAADFAAILGLAWVGKATSLEMHGGLISLIILWQNFVAVRRDIRRAIRR